MSTSTSAISRIEELELAWVRTHSDVHYCHVAQPVYRYGPKNVLVVDRIGLKGHHLALRPCAAGKEDCKNTLKTPDVKDCLISEVETLKESILCTETACREQPLAQTEASPLL